MTDASPPNGSAVLRLRDFLPYRLSVLSNTVSSAIAEAYAERFDLTIWQWRCMAVIGEKPGLSARELAAQTAMDKVAVSRAVSGLEDQGRIRREADSQDRRTSRLMLTDLGKQIYSEIVPLAKSYETALLNDLSDAECQQLLTLLTKLARTATGGKADLW